MNLYGGFSFRRALKDYGWAVALAVAIVALVAGTYTRSEGVVQTEVVKPAAQAFGLVPTQCPDGWKTSNTSDVHVVVESCFSGDPKKPKPGEWLVVLNNGRFEYGLQIDTPGASFIKDPSKVTGWR